MVKKKLSEAGFSKKEGDARRVIEILKILKREYPEAKCSLNHKSPFELLISTILSAQCTDERVNMTTPALFAKYPGPEQLSKAKLPDVEKLIRSTGFFKAKAKSIVETSKLLMEKHGGQVPRDMDALVHLRGVGRKTANVVLGNGYGIPGFPVDTHVKRLTNRLGLTKSSDPVKIEMEVTQLVPKEDWTQFSNLLIWHGREICMARNPQCDDCPISRYCPKIGVSVQRGSKYVNEMQTL